MRWSVLLVLLAACGDNLKEPDYLGYGWDDRRVVCSEPIDDLSHPVDWGFVDDEIDRAARGRWALLLHAHRPTETVSLDALAHVLDRADARGLTYETYRDLGPDTAPHGALALAFDDDSVDLWMVARDLLLAHHARVTFFVTRWPQLTAAERGELDVLHGDGDDLEPHSIDHVNAVTYAAAHGIDGYLTEEVLPSFEVLIDAGDPPPAAFAYPFGAHTKAIDTAVLPHVQLVRTTPGECPWAGWGG